MAVGTDDLGADRWAVIAWGTVDMYASTIRADEGGLTSGQECGEAEAVQLRLREDVGMRAVKDANEDREGGRRGAGVDCGGSSARGGRRGL